MGKIADRLARRNDPLYAQAKNIVRAASAYSLAYDDEEFDRLIEQIEPALQSLPAPEFDRLLELAFDAAEPRRDGEDVAYAIDDALEQLCETLPGNGEAPDGYLVALPLVVEDCNAAWQIPVAAPQVEGAVQALKEFGLVVDDAKVTFLPRVLGALEGDILLHGEVYRLTRLLAQQRFEEAEQVLRQARARVGLELPPEGTSKDASVGQASVGVLVAFVTSADSEPFPLAMELNHALGESVDDEGSEDDDEIGPAVKQAFEDVRSVLATAAERLAKALAVSSLTLLDPPEGWFSGVFAARRLERETRARMWLLDIAEQHADGKLEVLCFGDHVEPPTARRAWFEVHVHLKADRKLLGSHAWHPLSHENDDDCFDALSDFLDSTGLKTLSETGSPAPAAKSGRGTLH